MRLSSRPISITGMILVDLESVCSGKETYRSAWYWPYEESELERLHGAKENSGAGTCTLPCCSTIAAAATTMASTRLEKTQKVAEGKRPVSYSVVITFSCRYPQVR